MDQDLSDNKPHPPPQPGNRSAREEFSVPSLIPDHELLKPIGYGSYGAVWLARSMMGIFRAVKVVYRDSFSDARPFERELTGIRKFEPISRSHEGFVDVLQVGMNHEQGYFYYVMELGDDENSGQDINPKLYEPKTLGRQISAQHKLSFQQCLELGLALSQALAELHKHGLVHRDVKPANIIFVNGIPKLADIGLVAEAREDQSYVGTAGFIPPEGPGTPQADIYGLGKVLYEASTGKDRQDFPELPEQLENFPDRNSFLELNEIILQACKKDRAQRYPTAWRMHADLLVLANGKSVRRLKVLERRLSNFKRIASVSVLILVLAALVGGQIYREWKISDDARQRLVGADVANGNNAMTTGDLPGALPYFASALQLEVRTTAGNRDERLRLGSVLAQCPKLTQMWFEQKIANTVEFSPDGKSVVVAEEFGQAKIFDVESGKQYLHAFAHEPALTSASFSPDGRRIATAAENGVVNVWDAATLERIRRWQLPQAVFTVQFSPDGSRLLAACNDHSARIWNLTNGNVEMTLPHGSEMRFAAFSRDGRLAVTGGTDHRARIWNVATGEPLGKPLPHGGWVDDGGFSPDGKRLVTGCGDHKARVWDVATGLQISPDLNHRDAVTSAAFSPDGLIIMTASLDGTIHLWRADNFQPCEPCSLLRQGEKVMHAAFDRDGRRIVVACADGSIRIWDLAGIAPPTPSRETEISRDGKWGLVISNNLVEIHDHVASESPPAMIRADDPIIKAEFSGNGQFFSTVASAKMVNGQTNQTARVWNTASGAPVGPAIIFTNALEGISTSDDGRHLIVFWDSDAQIWDTHTGQPQSSVLKHDDQIRQAFFRPNNQQVATVSGKQVNVWNVLTGQASFPPLEHKQPVNYAEYSPNGSQIVSCCTDSSYTKCYAQIWDAATGNPVEPPLFHNDGVLSARFSPDGRRVATASEDFTAALWDVASGRQLTVPALQHDEKVTSAAFSPDGKWVVTASVDKTARIWSAETGEPLMPPLRGVSIMVNAIFLADDRRVATFDQRGRVLLWNLPVDERPVADLGKLARLLSGDMAAASGPFARTKSESLAEIWTELKAKYPSDFQASTAEIIAWNKTICRQSEYEGQWQAAVFHLRLLAQMIPGDAAIQAELSDAEQHLKTL